MLFLYFISGLIFGSFASAMSFRLLKGESILKPSHCPKCKTKLSALELIPVLSFILSGGKCRNCKRAISLRYPLIELTTGAMFFIVGMIHPLDFETLIILFVVVNIVILMATDFEEYIIPDEVQIALGFAGLVYSMLKGYGVVQIICMPLLCFGIAILLQKSFHFFMKKDALGMGDVKLFAVSGLFLTPDMLPTFFLLSGIIGIIISIIWRMTSKGEEFPFGPALGLALYACIVFPESSSFANYVF